jgi:hypothetical protein
MVTSAEPLSGAGSGVVGGAEPSRGNGIARRGFIGCTWLRRRSILVEIMRPMIKTVPVIAAVAALLGTTAAAASPPEVGHFDGTIQFDPQVSDLPCLEGRQFLQTGGESFHGTFVADDGFLHITNIEKFFNTAVPVDGQGPTYVEAPNVNKTTFTVRAVSAGDEIVHTNVNNDRFVGYVDGRRVASATIRIHELEHFVALDTDGDGAPDAFKVSVTISDFSCPD